MMLGAQSLGIKLTGLGGADGHGWGERKWSKNSILPLYRRAARTPARRTYSRNAMCPSRDALVLMVAKSAVSRPDRAEGPSRRSQSRNRPSWWIGRSNLVPGVAQLGRGGFPTQGFPRERPSPFNRPLVPSRIRHGLIYLPSLSGDSPDRASRFPLSLYSL